MSDEQLLLKEGRTWYVAALLCYLERETGLAGMSPEGSEGPYWTVVPSKKKKKKKKKEEEEEEKKKKKKKRRRRRRRW